MADGATMQVQITAKTVTRAKILEMVRGLGLHLDPAEIHRVTISREEIVVEKPMRRNAEGFLEARILTIPVVG